MKIATWNVNSLKIRLPHVLTWLEQTQTDVLCIQETKLTDQAFPVQALKLAGYDCAFVGQKAFNGVAIISKYPLHDIVSHSPLSDDESKRLIAATINHIRFVCAYVPFGESVSSQKYQYKLDWLNAFKTWLANQMSSYRDLVFLGDCNIAPNDQDIYDARLFHEQVPISSHERNAWTQICELGLTDAFSLFEQPAKAFTCWDYRQRAFQRNMGMRIDHILLSNTLVSTCCSCEIDRSPRAWERPSDHAPVIAQLNC